jgi:hypothetical protein
MLAHRDAIRDSEATRMFAIELEIFALLMLWLRR